MTMNVGQLRDNEHVESVESTKPEWRRDDAEDTHWHVIPAEGAWDTEEGVEFLLSLNCVWDFADRRGFLVRKGKIR